MEPTSVAALARVFLASNIGEDVKTLVTARKGEERKMLVIAKKGGAQTPLWCTPTDLDKYVRMLPDHTFSLPDVDEVNTTIPARNARGEKVGAMDPSSYLGAMHALREGRELINPGGDYRSFGN